MNLQENKIGPNRYDSMREVFGDAITFAYAVSEAERIIGNTISIRRADSEIAPELDGLSKYGVDKLKMSKPDYSGTLAELMKYSDAPIIAEVIKELEGSISDLEWITHEKVV